MHRVTTTRIANPTLPLVTQASITGRRVVSPFFIGPVCVDPPLLQAPMAGYTNYAFRQMVRAYGGVGLQATEMISAQGFIGRSRSDQQLPERLWGVAEEPRPLAVQIWDNDPVRLAEVGASLAHDLRVSVVDINFGCPVRQVTEKAHSGSYLLRDPDRMFHIISRVVKACAPTPVTAKIRLGCSRNTINAVEVAQVVESAGAAALTVHGRTAQDMFRGSADWERIAEIKPYLKKIPLIGNGDLDTPEKVLAAFQRYPVDGVMIARACLGRPWLFRQAQQALREEAIDPDPDLDTQRACMLWHFDLLVERFGEAKAAVLMRKYACTYAIGQRGSREFRKQIAAVGSRDEFLESVERYFPRDATTASMI